MKKYVVDTHLGKFETCATSERKAISNVRFRLFGRSATLARRYMTYWTAKEVA
jgi:hypothetical protein